MSVARWEQTEDGAGSLLTSSVRTLTCTDDPRWRDIGRPMVPGDIGRFTVDWELPTQGNSGP